jgi:hypothetical protein
MANKEYMEQQRTRSKKGDKCGHLIQFTERRLVYWGWGGQEFSMGSDETSVQRVPWPRKAIEHGILQLSLDISRCVRASSKNREESKQWKWSHVPTALRHLLSEQGLNSGNFDPEPENITEEEDHQEIMFVWSGLGNTDMKCQKGNVSKFDTPLPDFAGHTFGSLDRDDDM